MTSLIVRYLNIILAALVTGTIFGIWLGYDPRDLSAPAFIEQQQSAIRALNTIMPLLGLVTILLTLLSAFLQRKDKGSASMLLAAAVFLVGSGLITRFGNQPINAIVMTWNIQAGPDNWESLRDQWWTFHIYRMVTSIIGLCLVVWVGIKRT